jgi:hypothetical protein
MGYLPAPMSNFFASLFAEMGARRKRLRAALGDRAQGFVEFLVLVCLVAGSIGLFARPWMADAAPWGFALPLVFVLGYLAIEARRQAAPEHNYDWWVLLWSFGCALAGAAALVIAWSAAPATPPPEVIWTPPEDAVGVNLDP